MSDKRTAPGISRPKRLLATSLAAYRLLLLFFPAPFRQRFRRDLEDAFSDALRDAQQQGGAMGYVKLWLKTLPDLIFGGLRERLAPGELAIVPAASGRRFRRPGWRSPEPLLKDLRFGLRTLAKSAGFSLVVVATIALGVGASTAIFTVVDGILLRPLPFPDSERVVILCETHSSVDHCGASPPNLRDWAASSSTIQSMGLARGWPFVARRGEERFGVRGGIATPGYFELLRLRPALGRLFSEGDMLQGNNRVAILSHAYWQSRFGADETVVGQRFTIDDEPYLIIGVLDAQPRMPRFGWVELWKPLTAITDNFEDRSWRGFTALGRLEDGATLEQAGQELSAIQAGLAERYPDSNKDWGVRLVPLQRWIVGSARTPLLAFFGSVAFLMLIACANVANLMLTRSGSRSEEFALRLSLGASRWRLAQQTLCESLLLALPGGMLGMLLAFWGTEAFLSLAPGNIPRLGEVGLDGRALWFALLASFAAAFLFGLAPAWFASRAQPGEALKGVRSVVASGGRLRSALVALETGLALVLLLGAGLLMRSFANISAWDPGFDTRNLYILWMLASPGKYSDGQQFVELQSRAAEEVLSLPSVTATGLTSAGPLFGGMERGEVTIEGASASDPPGTARWFDISPGYFAALGIGLLAGRDFDPSDSAASPAVAIVNQAMARRHWPQSSPLGHRISMYGRSMEVVGVVRNVAPLDPDLPPQPEVYWPKRQYPRLATYMVIRSQGAGEGLEEQVRQRLAELDPDLQISGFVPIETMFSREMVPSRFNMLISGVFASVALILAGIGIYGVFAYFVSSRRREIGVRIALGAAPGKIVRAVVSRGLALAGVGMALGAAAGLGLSSLISAMLHGVRPQDPLTWIAVAAVLFLVVLVACYLPARRASRVDPLIALRS